jgi:hypothetical protein
MVRIVVQKGFWDLPPPILLSKSSSTSSVADSTELPRDPRKRKTPTTASDESIPKENNLPSSHNQNVFTPHYLCSFPNDDYHKRVQESLSLLRQNLYAAPTVLVAHDNPPMNTNNKNKATHQSGTTTNVYVPKVICKYWMEGKCSKGSQCTFSHALSPTTTPDQARSTHPCTFHRLGQCMKGSKCLFSHDLTRWPCKYFHLNGRCKEGEGCRFSHREPLDEEGRRLLDEMDREEVGKKRPIPPHNNNYKKGNHKKKAFQHHQV